MPVKPPPFKLKCPKCGHSKIMKPTSDIWDPREHFCKCQKCNVPMEKTEFSLFDKLFIKYL